jgi:hypothetical protein
VNLLFTARFLRERGCVDDVYSKVFAVVVCVGVSWFEDEKPKGITIIPMSEANN